MASVGSNFPDDGDDDRFDPPRPPRLILKDDPSGTEELSPDTEENVTEQAEGVFRQFVYNLYTLDRNSPESDPDSPRLRELTDFRNIATTPSAAYIGRQLAVIGDSIHSRYTPEFNQMIRMLNLTPETAYEAFAGVARKLFRDGQLSWGRVVTLLCFGYRMAVTVLERGMQGFFSHIVGFVVRFIVTERIARWIADQGGWRAALRYIPETVGWPTLGAIVTVAALSMLAAFFVSNKK